MRDLIAAIFLLEIIARIIGPANRTQPYLVSLTAAEPMTPLDQHLSAVLFGESDDQV